VAFLAVEAIMLGCGGSSVSGAIPAPSTPANQPTFAHVILLLEENHSYSDVIGNSSMPYINSLAQKYGSAAQYYADAHPSLPNYFMLTAGKTETNTDSFNGVVSDDNVVRELVKAGKSWKSYAEGLPSAGYLGGDVYPYFRHHNPFTYLSDVQNSAAQAANIVPFTQFATDLASNALPQYAFIAPNALDDAHDGTLPQADSWLQQNIAQLIANANFQSSGLLIITFDESETTDIAHGGGHVPMIVVSSQAKKNYVSQTVFQHESTLRLTLAASGVNSFPGAAVSFQLCRPPLFLRHILTATLTIDDERCQHCVVAAVPDSSVAMGATKRCGSIARADDISPAHIYGRFDVGASASAGKDQTGWRRLLAGWRRLSCHR
jgi:phosphatidylinositol-3-phosphatase